MEISWLGQLPEVIEAKPGLFRGKDAAALGAENHAALHGVPRWHIHISGCEISARVM